ncbi:hypothetical protein H4219_002921 [Mycoemilia scoparia]|uniref:NADH dehydrogenase [ubiquinone] 1 beta subcomplex subunit 4 n=1 Tax=Mycoemilia scoparia TaxID=417184 RepID=A0A9W7ZWB6_9FUNG|nr:hypothetical protein H4219_002921 [Mycoemilia scoparia]
MGANGHDSTLLKDPAIERWLYMRATTQEHFRWTRYTAKMGVIFCVAVPAALYYIGSKSQGGYNFAVDVRKKADEKHLSANKA